MLDLSILRGPLRADQREQILREFNRLTNSHIPPADFRRWVEDSPDGAAFHALLTLNGQIVGHFSLIPLGALRDGKRIPVARTEYFFVHEDFRSEKVRGFEGSFLSPAILLLDELYRHCQAQGWGPFLVSAAEEIQPFHELVGCRPVDFRLHECLFALRPGLAAGQTPNLRQAQRAALFATSVAQAGLWNVAGWMIPRRTVETSSVEQVPQDAAGCGIAFFAEKESRMWRYPKEEYFALRTASEPDSFVIAKIGSEDRYLRVCQWRLASSSLAPSFVRALIDLALDGKMLGVRWAIFENEPNGASLLRSLRGLAFLCVPRVRRLLVYSEDSTFERSSTWRLSDSLFCFDL